MSRAQQGVLAAGLAAVLLAALFPPWRHVGAQRAATDVYDVKAAFGFILNPPRVQYPEGGDVVSERLRVDPGLLLVELASILSFTGLVIIVLGYRAPSGMSPRHP